MEGLSKPYTVLFNAVTDALTALDRLDFGTARELLVQGQLQGEAWFINGEAPKEDAKETVN